MSFYNAALGGRRNSWDEGDRLVASIGGFGRNPDDKIYTQLMHEDCEETQMPMDDGCRSSQRPDPLELTEEDIQKLWENGTPAARDNWVKKVENENRRLGLQFRDG